MRGGVKRSFQLLLVCSTLLWGIGVACAAAVVEADPDLQLVMGDLSTLVVAMRYHAEAAPKASFPSLEQLGHHFDKSALPSGWGEDFRTAEHNGEWWVGRKVPEFSRGRKFMRAHSAELEIFEQPGGASWFSGGYAWVRVRSSASGKEAAPRWIGFGVVQGEGDEARHLFVTLAGTDYFWWSNLLFTPQAQGAILKAHGAARPEGGLSIPDAPQMGREDIKASPVGLPEEFTVSGDHIEGEQLGVGDVIFNPIPRPRD